MIIEEHIPIKLSAPCLLKRASYVAIEAPPESGFVNAKGKISLGIFRKSHSGAKTDLIKSAIPDEEKIAIDTERAHIVGRSPHAVFKPSFAPSLNDEK